MWNDKDTLPREHNREMLVRFHPWDGDKRTIHRVKYRDPKVWYSDSDKEPFFSFQHGGSILVNTDRLLSWMDVPEWLKDETW